MWLCSNTPYTAVDNQSQQFDTWQGGSATTHWNLIPPLDSYSEYGNTSKNKPPKFFPWLFGSCQFFWEFQRKVIPPLQDLGQVRITSQFSGARIAICGTVWHFFVWLKGHMMRLISHFFETAACWNLNLSSESDSARWDASKNTPPKFLCDFLGSCQFFEVNFQRDLLAMSPFADSDSESEFAGAQTLLPPMPDCHTQQPLTFLCLGINTYHSCKSIYTHRSMFSFTWSTYKFLLSQILAPQIIQSCPEV